jgi:hypothetical protein
MKQADLEASESTSHTFELRLNSESLIGSEANLSTIVGSSEWIMTPPAYLSRLYNRSVKYPFERGPWLEKCKKSPRLT